MQLWDLSLVSSLLCNCDTWWWLHYGPKRVVVNVINKWIYNHLECCTIRRINKQVVIKNYSFLFISVFHVLCHYINSWPWKTGGFISWMFCTIITILTCILTNNTNKMPHKATIQENYCQSPLLSFCLVLNIKLFHIFHSN
jgi:hypothetical protein